MKNVVIFSNKACYSCVYYKIVLRECIGYRNSKSQYEFVNRYSVKLMQLKIVKNEL